VLIWNKIKKQTGDSMRESTKETILCTLSDLREESRYLMDNFDDSETRIQAYEEVMKSIENLEILIQQLKKS
jgi:hypothetical protein